MQDFGDYCQSKVVFCRFRLRLDRVLWSPLGTWLVQCPKGVRIIEEISEEGEKVIKRKLGSEEITQTNETHKRVGLHYWSHSTFQINSESMVKL